MGNDFPLPGPEKDRTGSSLNWIYLESGLSRKIRWLILWRLVFVSLLLILTVLLQEKEGYFSFPFSFFSFNVLIALQYFFSLVYILVMVWGKALRAIAMVQLVMDVLFVTAVVYVSGGIESLFSFLYFLIILAGGVLFFRWGGLLTALFVLVSYALLLLFQGAGVIPFYFGLPDLPAPVSRRYLYYQIIMNGLGFFFVGFLGSVFTEETRRQRSQIETQKKNIEQLEQLNRIVVENLEMGLLTLDHENKILSINQAGEKILGKKATELVRQPLETLFPEAYSLPDGGETSEGQRSEVSYSTPEGALMIIGYTQYRLKEGQAPGIGTIVSFKDISRIKTMEDHLRQVDRLALLGRMAAGIAHEVRNPLASISGSIQVLRDDYHGNETGERLLNIVSRELAKLDGLMNNFLAFTRGVQSSATRINVSELILETVDLMKKNREFPSSILWKLEITPDLFLKISASELSQVLFNLITNALQALAADGEILIRARELKTGLKDDTIEILIRDNGAGINETDQKKIFEPFYTTKSRGTGLGLSIVQKIVSDYDGRILLESRLGAGTTFTIQFPDRGR
ncbi:MAG: ATP-binding protein [Thermodesulfobacteriota bacterium]